MTHHVCAATEQEARAQIPGAAAKVLLVRIYRDSYQGGPHYSLTADAACDPAGWGFSDLSSFNDGLPGISSWRTYNQCSGQVIYSEEDYVSQCGPHYGPNSWAQNVPWACNDHVLSMKVYQHHS